MNRSELLKRAAAADSLVAVFVLMLNNDDGSRRDAAEQIRKLSAEQRRDLRAAIQNLDYLLDDVFLAEMRERRPWKL